MSDPGRRHVFTPARDANPAAWAIVFGICLAFAALFMAFFPAGAGHGWGAPFFLSIPLLAVLPIVLVRSRAEERTGVAWDIGLVLLAVAADYYLVGNAVSFRENIGRIHDEFLVPGVHRSVFPMFVLWLGIWLFWQWLAIRTLVRHFLRGATSANHP